MTDQEKKIYAEAMEKKRLALSVRTIRESRKMSRQELAGAAGYESSSMITSIENGTNSPSYDKVKDLANALGVTIAQLKCRGKIDTDPSGWPKLNESEKISLYLIAPMLKVLSDQDIEDILHITLKYCQASGKSPAWKQTEYQVKKSKGDASYTKEPRDSKTKIKK